MALMEMRPGEVLESAKELENLRNQHLELMRNLRTIIMGLQEDWEGESEAALEEAFISQSLTMTEFDETLQRFILLAKSAVSEATSLDDLLTSAIKK